MSLLAHLDLKELTIHSNYIHLDTGQGGGQAIEDGASLGMFFNAGTKPSQVTQLLEMFQRARYNRASTIMQLSAGEEGTIRVDPRDTEPFIMPHDAMEYAKQMRTTEIVANY